MRNGTCCTATSYERRERLVSRRSEQQRATAWRYSSRPAARFVDGDIDLLVTNIDSVPSLIRNDTQMLYPSLRVTLVGRAANRSAYGATVIISSGGVRQRFELRDSDGYAGANDARLIVFLPGGVADTVEIRWPGGGTTTLSEQGPGSILVDQQRGLVARTDR